MNIAKFCIEKKTITLVLTVVLSLVGLNSYQTMSRLEDPEFTIKDALVVTAYPGATAEQVEEEVTDEIEIAVQKLGQLDEIESKSSRGLSSLTVSIKESYDKSTLPQVWDELRRKVSDAQGGLPPGAGTSIVIDDYGDVYGIFFVVYGEDYSYAELKKVTDLLRKELLLVQDVAKIDVMGEMTEAVYVELDHERLSLLGITPELIIRELQAKNLVVDPGRAKVGEQFISMDPTGMYTTVDEFNDLLINAGNRQFYLKDVAKVRRDYVYPYSNAVRFDGSKAIAMGISTVSGGNVVTMGQALEARMNELITDIPVGIEFGIISMQSTAVTTAISGFVISLVEAVVIVIAVLLVFMGFRSGFLIGAILIITIIGSFLFLKPMGVALERISLGALIIALGMLVDNAIVVVDGILVGLQKRKTATQAALDVVKQSSIPLLGATIIAILAFAAIGTSQDSTGEFCRSLYQVICVSLFLSWVIAVTVTPLFGVMFLKPPAEDVEEKDPYDSKFYNSYKVFLKKCIDLRWVTVGVVVVLFVASVIGFKNVKQSFFPPSTRPQFLVDFWLPEGTHIEESSKQSALLEEMIKDLDGVTHVSSIIGQGGLRFLLTYTPEKANPAFVQLFVDVEDSTYISTLIPEIEQLIFEEFPEANAYAYPFELGPGSKGKIQAEIIGDDADVLRSIAGDVTRIFQDHPNAKGITNDWRERTKVIRPVIIDEHANDLGIKSSDIAIAIRRAFEGQTVGVYREEDLLLPIVLRTAEDRDPDVDSLKGIQLWSPIANRNIPLVQLVSGFETAYEDAIIYRQDRKRTMTIACDPKEGVASALFAELRASVEELELPEGYSLNWSGEYEDAGKAQTALAGGIPLYMGIMVLITICLFNSLRQPLVIWLCVPLAIIGVSFGLLSTGQPFGFMALLGFLSLTGMLIKNAIVLIDEINVQLADGLAPMDALLSSGASRLRPVAMAASTTALGMLPLFFDAFFVSMAVTIVFGLMCATVLTMIVVPVFYAIIYKIK